VRKDFAAAICTLGVMVVSVLLPAVIGNLSHAALSGPGAEDIPVVGAWLIGILAIIVGTIILTTLGIIVKQVFRFFKYEVF